MKKHKSRRKRKKLSQVIYIYNKGKRPTIIFNKPVKLKYNFL